MRKVERHVHVGGTELFIRDIGEGDPVVLFNGIGAHVEMWHPLEHMLEGMRIVSFDAPGSGRSQTRPVPFTMRDLARLVERLFDELELGRADVIGYSFGGALAQQFAVQVPERIRRLVLAATIPGWGGVPGRLAALLSMGTPLRYYSREFYERTAGTIAGGRARYDIDHVRRLWRDRVGHVPSPTGYAHQLWAITFWSSLPWLGRIETPTLIVAGDDDPLVPLSNAFMMASRMPNARVFVGADEGHFQLLDEQSTALPAIREFLGAARCEDSQVWLNAATINRVAAAEQMRSDGLGALPWGAVSAAFRQVFA